MARKGFSPEQIALKLKEIELQIKQGKTAGEASRSQGITEQTYLPLATEIWGHGN